MTSRIESPPLGRTLIALAVCLVAPLAVGALSGLATQDGVRTWYQQIVKPGFTPPDSLFGPVWTALYFAMGCAAFLVWRAGNAGADARGVRVSLIWFVIQLFANSLWSVIFFGLQNPGLAFAEILVLLALIAVTTRSFWDHSRLAAALMVPYLLWVSFATALNFSIWRLNA